METPSSMVKNTSCSDQSTGKSPSSNSPELHNDHYDNDLMLESFLRVSDSDSINTSFHRLVESRSSDSDKHDFIQRAIHLSFVLLEAGKRSDRKRCSLHNTVVWPLPPDLTIKVFAMLDTQSVCYAAATCSFFQKCAADALCFANIDLITSVPKVNNGVVSSMIQRAGNALLSIKLGVLPHGTSSLFGSSEPLVSNIRNSSDASGVSWNDKRSRQGKESCILTRSCLSSLSENGGAPGARLRRLHLFNIERMDNAALLTSLASCPFLLDLEIVGVHVELRQTLESVSKHCPLMERLVFESSKTGRDDCWKTPACNEFVRNCPNITTLALKGFKLQDYKVHMLLKGLCKLKHVDFSNSFSFTGACLKNLGANGGGNQLEVMILRDCLHLKETEVEHFLGAVVAGEFKLLRHLDISNREGLASDGGDWIHRCYTASFIPIKQLLEERPDFTLVAEFPERSYSDAEQTTPSDSDSYVSDEDDDEDDEDDNEEEDDDDDDDDDDDNDDDDDDDDEDDEDDDDEHEDREYHRAALESRIREFEEINLRRMEEQTRQTTESITRMEDFHIAHIYGMELERNRAFEYQERLRHHYDYHAGLPYVETPPHVDYSTLGPYTQDKPHLHYPQSHPSRWLPLQPPPTSPEEGSSSQSLLGSRDPRSVYLRVMESIFGPPSRSP
ncbi:hypothetical protein QVD17_03068 [Tagetes erecta]|uniref:F-box domain-containing protein n=1 Tax=Tagetes erecta TaxID=13708 RepID=A0AAD8LAA6_TARER|nr:hypothetical protein QVD17_03068 [Tagetes erecta]